MIGFEEGVAGGRGRIAGVRTGVKVDQPLKVASQIFFDLFGPLVKQQSAGLGSLLFVRSAGAAAHAFAPAGKGPFALRWIQRLQPGTAGEEGTEGQEQREDWQTARR